MLVRLLGATVLALVFSSNGVAADACSPLTPDHVVHAWTFDDGTSEGWGEPNCVEGFGVENGALCGRSTALDAYFVVRDIRFPTDGITHLRLRMRSTEPGVTQVYFGTRGQPNPGLNGVGEIRCRAGAAFEDYDVKLEDLRGWEGDLTALRVDPANGHITRPRFEIDSIAFVRCAPRAALLDFHAADTVCPPGGQTTLRLSIEHRGGGQLPVGDRAEALRARLECHGDDAVEYTAGAVLKPWTPLDPNNGAACYAAEWRISGLAETARYTASIDYGDRTLLSADALVVVADLAEVPQPSGVRTVAVLADGTGAVEDEQVSLRLLGRHADARWGLLRARPDGGEPWRVMGVVAPLVTCAVRDAAGADRCSIPAFALAVSGDDLVLHGMEASSRPRLRAAFRRGTVQGLVHYDATAEFTEEGDLLRFSGPRYLAGEGSFGGTKETALFPGIEFLDADDRSSDTRSAGTAVGFRHTPLPFQITVPLMAVHAGGMTTGVLWDALQPWHASQNMPMATFSSPSFLQDQENHLMEVFAPNWPAWTERNAWFAARPMPVAAGATVSLSGYLFACRQTDITEAVPLWYAAYGKPVPPPVPGTMEEMITLLMRGRATTMYDAETDTYTSHWRHGLPPGPAGSIKARMVAHAHLTGDDSLAEAMGVSGHASLRSLRGSLFGVWPPAKPAAPMQSQRADGSWGYALTEKVARRAREHTQGEYETLGREGDTNLGLCAAQALPILAYAVATGDGEAEEAGLRALDAMARFRIPAGSQTWEVHMDAPDIFGSANALACFAMGWRLTGRQDLRDAARYWAYTGLPFLYSYAVPLLRPDGNGVVPGDPLTEGKDYMEGAHPLAALFENPARRVTPYGSIPVFGTSFYTATWFGNIVQWCGLRWAEDVLRARDLMDDPLLTDVARGVIASGCQQTFDKPPVLGCIPDAWQLQGNTAFPPYIGPSLVENPLRLLTDHPSYCDIRTQVVRGADTRAHVSTWDTVTEPQLADGWLRWRQRYLVAAGAETFVAGLPTPTVVIVDGTTLPSAAELEGGRCGWQYDATTGYLRLRAKQEAPEAAGEPLVEIRVEVLFGDAARP